MDTLLSLLLKHQLPLDTKNKEGKTPLHLATKQDNKQTVKLLLHSQANLEAKTKWEKNTPIHIAASEGKTDLLPYIIAKRANLNATNQGGLTPIQEAGHKEQLASVGILLEQRADLPHHEKTNKPTLIQQAAEAGHVEAVKFSITT